MSDLKHWGIQTQFLNLFSFVSHVQEQCVELLSVNEAVVIAI